ncbi:Sec-independent protein translocase protein TatAd [bioreactor metagenome]|uniref:Sec-independent protein translocase protein TatAd n=1 Tax=bioreactor metagenome TaxID=1076179 RepID=A0A645GWC7_9ZZZZ|nr:twin-arginine translocase TatA/TatE family subunit [Syntrophomonadaceae bacterium]
MFGNIGPWELILILVIVLVIFGPGKLPKIGESLGKAMVSFKQAKEGEADEKVVKEK